MRQYRFSRYDAEEFSSHERGEAFDRPTTHPGPLRVSTRDADNRFTRRIYTQGAEQLGFFAPHNIRSFGVSLRNPWEYPDVTRLSRNRDGTLQDECEMRRRVDVSSLNPSLPGTRHAADHNRQVICGADGIEMRLQHGREAKLGCRHHAFLAASFLQDAAGPVDEPKPKAARAPIDCGVFSLAHFTFVPMFGIR
jgi:hypothetical protein